MLLCLNSCLVFRSNEKKQILFLYYEKYSYWQYILAHIAHNCMLLFFILLTVVCLFKQYIYCGSTISLYLFLHLFGFVLNVLKCDPLQIIFFYNFDICMWKQDISLFLLYFCSKESRYDLELYLYPGVILQKRSHQCVFKLSALLYCICHPVKTNAFFKRIGRYSCYIFQQSHIITCSYV